MTGEPIAIMCPRCQAVRYAKSLTQVFDMVRAMWEVAMKASTKEMQEALRPYIGAAAGVKPKELQELIKKNGGHLKMICSKCNADLSEEMYRKAGIDIVRYGDYIFTRSFYEKNEALIKESIKI